MKKAILPLFITFKHVILSLLLFLSSSIIAQDIQPEENQTLFQHLNSVNKEWSKQNVLLEILEKNISFSSDKFRIQMHLLLVEKVLRERINTKLTTTQVNKRNHFLDVLNKYALSGVFPRNLYHDNRQPYIVDHLETACAVGHLIKESGAAGLVRKIKEENNFAYLIELKDKYQEIDKWVDENGFTIDELAWIQPGYSPASQSYSQVGNGGGVEGKINVMRMSEDGSVLYMAGDFTEIDGVSANSIIAWDGENWITFGAGVEGEIFAIATSSQDKIYIGGNFNLYGSATPTNIAFWNGTNWESLQNGAMNGTVYTLLNNYGELIAGGDFQTIDSKPIKYLAKLSNSANPEWNNYIKRIIPGTSNYEYMDNVFTVNGPVRSIQNIDGYILIGGSFSETAPDISDINVNSFYTKNLCYCYNNNWEIGFDDALESIEFTFHGSDGKIYTAGNLDHENDLGIFYAGIWEFDMFEQLDTDNGEDRFHGFVEHNETIYGYGDITPYLGQVLSHGFIRVGGEDGSSGKELGAQFDRSVRASEVFQQEIYFAGDFTTVNSSNANSNFNGLTKSSFVEDVNSIEEGFFVKNKIQIFNVENKLNIRYENLGENTTLNIFNLQGQILESINLEKGNQDLEIGLSHWSGGMYVFQAINKDGKQTGKFHVN